eukprot:24451_4
MPCRTEFPAIDLLLQTPTTSVSCSSPPGFEPFFSRREVALQPVAQLLGGNARPTVYNGHCGNRNRKAIKCQGDERGTREKGS